MKYKNIVTGEITEYEYRFKTREEFENEYGESWSNIVRCNWYDDDYEGMNYLFGKNIDFFSDDELTNVMEDNSIEYYEDGDNSWSISKDMIIRNRSLKFDDIYFGENDRLVYEKRIISFNEYKKGDF